MASVKKRGAGDRVLEGKHVIGLFLLMLLFSAIFFSLGYVMGHSQYEGAVSAGGTPFHKMEPTLPPKPEVAAKKPAEIPPASGESDPAVSASPEWDFPNSNLPAKTDPKLEPVAKPVAPSTVPKTLNAKDKLPSASAAPAAKTNSNAANTPLIPSGALVLQVAALKNRDEALSIATSLQKKHFAAYVQSPQKDQYYRVQVGPLKDQKTADATKKDLEGAGFKAFVAKR